MLDRFETTAFFGFHIKNSSSKSGGSTQNSANRQGSGAEPNYNPTTESIEFVRHSSQPQNQNKPLPLTLKAANHSPQRPPRLTHDWSSSGGVSGLELAVACCCAKCCDRR